MDTYGRGKERNRESQGERSRIAGLNFAGLPRWNMGGGKIYAGSAT